MFNIIDRAHYIDLFWYRLSIIYPSSKPSIHSLSSQTHIQSGAGVDLTALHILPLVTQLAEYYQFVLLLSVMIIGIASLLTILDK